MCPIDDLICTLLSVPNSLSWKLFLASEVSGRGSQPVSGEPSLLPPWAEAVNTWWLEAYRKLPVRNVDGLSIRAAAEH